MLRIATTKTTFALSSSLVKCTQRRPTAAAVSRRCKSTANIKHSSGSSTGNTATTANGTTTSTTPNNTTTTTTGVPVGMSLIAAISGVAVVGVAATIVEYVTSTKCLPYSTNGQRFEQGHFAGRFSRMILACDPKLLLYSESQVRQAQDLLATYQQQQQQQQEHSGSTNATTNTDDRSLWEARRITDAAVHPDTGEIIPRPFRMSGYVPYNGPICVAMVASTSTVPLLFWSWVNQSQNALVNYYNRNASSPMSNETLMTSYSVAVGSALAVAFGLSTFIQRRYPVEQAKAMMKYVAFPSAVVASSLNCYIVRSPEIQTGVPLTDVDGKVVLPNSTSNVAAKRGVESTTLSRALLQAPVYFVPPVLMGSIGPLRRLVDTNPRLRVPITTFLVLISFGIGLPVTTAIFPQVAEIDAKDTEPQFQHLINPKTQQPYTVYYYNKGL